MAFFSKWFSRTSSSVEKLTLPEETSFEIEIEPGTIQGHFLVVDDEPDIVDMMRRVLEARGHTVETANNGEEALGKMQGSLPDLLIADLLMTEMDGFELIARCRDDSQLCNMGIITLVPRPSDSRVEDMLASIPKSRSGVDISLIKPLNPQKLIEAVDRVLGAS